MMMRKVCSLSPLLLLLLLLLLPSVCGGPSGGLRTPWYYKGTGFFTWDAAQSYCRKRYTDLVTIAGEYKNKFFFQGRGWIGLYRKDSSSLWRWSRHDEIANFTIWEHGEPSSGEENCAYKYSTRYVWNGHRCHMSHSFMCYDEKLLLVKEKKTWEEALSQCRALGAADPRYRYDLATLLIPDDLAFAREKTGGATTAEVWTGLRHLAGHWLWVGGEPVAGNLDRGCPTSLTSCGALEINSTHPVVPRNCEERKNFLCYRKSFSQDQVLLA